jgi:hypothetical protein
MKFLALLLKAAFVVSFFCVAAQAQTKLRTPQEIVTDIKTAVGPKAATPSIAEEDQSPFGKSVGSFRAEVQKLKKEAVDFAIADANAAIKDATNHNDVISLPCWQANLKMFQGLPIMWEQPPQEPIGLMLGVQISRDIINSITGNDKDSLKVACAALWGDQLKIIGNVAAMLGLRIATGGAL